MPDSRTISVNGREIEPLSLPEGCCEPMMDLGVGPTVSDRSPELHPVHSLVRGEPDEPCDKPT